MPAFLRHAAAFVANQQMAAARLLAVGLAVVCAGTAWWFFRQEDPEASLIFAALTVLALVVATGSDS